MESVIRTWWRHLIIFENVMACMTDDTDDKDETGYYHMIIMTMTPKCDDSDDHDESGVECTIA